jgi:hypothetical protein
MIVGLFINFLFQALCFHLVAGPWCERWQGKHEVEIIVSCNAVEAFQSASKTAMHEYMFAFTTLKVADRFQATTTRTHAISWSLLIDVTREKTKRTVISMMRSISRWTHKAMAVPALECLCCRCSLLAHKTRSGVFLFTQTQSSPVCFSQGWISSFASIGCTSFESSKARQIWPRKRKVQDPLWLSRTSFYT